MKNTTFKWQMPSTYRYPMGMVEKQEVILPVRHKERFEGAKLIRPTCHCPVDAPCRRGGGCKC